MHLRFASLSGKASLAALVLALAACSTTQPLPYAGVGASAQMRLNPRDNAGHMPYAYKTATDWHKYSSVMLDPVDIYRGVDNQFEDMSENDKAYLAQYMEAEFAAKLGKRFKSATAPGRDTLRIRLTLAGAKTNTAVLGTLSRFDLVGGPYNAVQAIRGKEGAMTGSVSFAVEIFDASTNALLGAYVSKQYPNAWNLGAGMGSLSASIAGIENGADQLIAYLQ